MRETLEDYCNRIKLVDATIIVPKESAWSGFSIFALSQNGFYVEGNGIEMLIYDPSNNCCGSIRMKGVPGKDVITKEVISTKMVYEVKLSSTPHVDEAVKKLFPGYKKQIPKI